MRDEAANETSLSPREAEQMDQREERRYRGEGIPEAWCVFTRLCPDRSTEACCTWLMN